jgi:hypothetical protein
MSSVTWNNLKLWWETNKPKLQECIPWLAAAVSVLSAHLTANAVLDLLGKAHAPVSTGWNLSFAILFIGSVVYLFRKRNTLFRPRTQLLTRERVNPRKHLLLFLSVLNPGVTYDVRGIPLGLKLDFENLNTDLETMVCWKTELKKPFWQWEMPLRAIRAHLGPDTPETITVICSKESINQAWKFLWICRQYPEFHKIEKYFFLACRDGVTELLEPDSEKDFDDYQGWDFESFDDLSRALAGLLKKFKEMKIKEKEVMIDFTGGPKVASVVAAAMTFNRKIKAQYVQTNPDYQVFSYDIVMTSSDPGGLAG